VAGEIGAQRESGHHRQRTAVPLPDRHGAVNASNTDALQVNPPRVGLPLDIGDVRALQDVEHGSVSFLP
jgi:hypothetical protein